MGRTEVIGKYDWQLTQSMHTQLGCVHCLFLLTVGSISPTLESFDKVSLTVPSPSIGDASRKKPLRSVGICILHCRSLPPLFSARIFSPLIGAGSTLGVSLCCEEERRKERNREASAHVCAHPVATSTMCFPQPRKLRLLKKQLFPKYL